MTTSEQIYLETHHIVPLSEDGSDIVQNVAALCANHHREAHHGAARANIKASLLRMAKKKSIPPAV